MGVILLPVDEQYVSSAELVNDINCFVFSNEETSEFVAHMLLTFTVRPRSQPVLLQFCGKNISKKGMFGEPQVRCSLLKTAMLMSFEIC